MATNMFRLKEKNLEKIVDSSGVLVKIFGDWIFLKNRRFGNSAIGPSAIICLNFSI